jgi:hypothetical protein
MRKRWLLILTGLTAISLCAFWLHETGIVLGWLRGEAFYQGRPTSYWSRELARWQYGFVFGDFDGDGWPDLFVANDGLIGNGAVAADLDGDGGVVWVDSGLNGGYSRAPGLIDKVAGQFGITLDSADSPALLRGDPAAEAVLRELLDDPDPTVREHARRELERILHRRRDW